MPVGNSKVSRADFVLDLAFGGAIFKDKRLKNENAIPLAGLFELELVLVFEFAGGLGLFVRTLSPAPKRGFFVAEKRSRKIE